MFVLSGPISRKRAQKKKGGFPYRENGPSAISVFTWVVRAVCRPESVQRASAPAADRRPPSASGKKRSADDIIERLMRFVCLGSLQKSVQRLFKFVAHHPLSPHSFGIYSFHMVFYHDFIQNTT